MKKLLPYIILSGVLLIFNLFIVNAQINGVRVLMKDIYSNQKQNTLYDSIISEQECVSSIHNKDIFRMMHEGQINSPPIIKSIKTWNDAPHSGFTSLVRFQGKFFCVFREGLAHIGTEENLGKIRVIVSEDGNNWKSAALIREYKIDLRNPKLSVMPDGKLMIVCGGSGYCGTTLMEWHSRVMYSVDGENWTKPIRVKGIPLNNWIFGITWLGDTGFVVPRICKSDPATGRLLHNNTGLILFRTKDGLNYDQVSSLISSPVIECHEGGGCGEASIKFKDDSTMLIIVRLAEKGMLLFSKPPYQDFNEVEIKHSLGGASLHHFKDDLWLVGTRENVYERPEGREDTATILLLVDEQGNFKRLFEFPSGGDTSYPGIVIYDGKLWFTYYSSHEGRSAIYFSIIPFHEISKQIY